MRLQGLKGEKGPRIKVQILTCKALLVFLTIITLLFRFLSALPSSVHLVPEKRQFGRRCTSALKPQRLPATWCFCLPQVFQGAFTHSTSIGSRDMSRPIKSGAKRNVRLFLPLKHQTSRSDCEHEFLCLRQNTVENIILYILLYIYKSIFYFMFMGI